jgi:Papain-like cysteine protease AvrRpt2
LAQAEIPNVASSVGPTLAQFGNSLFAAWKGKGADQAIYYAHYDGARWSDQAAIPGVATAIGPSLCTYNGRLYAAWRGMNNDQALWYASFDGNRWSSQAVIPGVASSVGPSLAVFGGKLYAAWKGITGDEGLYFSSFDGSTWAAQQSIPNVASSIGPALSGYQGLLYAMWKGMGSDQGLYYSWFDGLRWAPQQRGPGNTGQDVPQNIGLRMQYQETSEWCWLVVAASVAHFYGATGWITQCNLMTTIGQNINGWPPTTICCPTSAILTAHPDLVGKMLNPYDTSAEFCLESVGIPSVCIKSGGINDALKVNNNYAGYRTSMSLDEIAAEINAGRPLAVDITWNSGGSHVVAIAGVLNDLLLICDPANGETVMSVENFPAQYYGGATLDGYALTKAS